MQRCDKRKTELTKINRMISIWFRYYIWEPVVISPLRRLYFYGPSNLILGLGFWEGAKKSTICAKVKNTEESIWALAPDHCDKITEDLFQSFVVMVETIIWFYLLVQIMFLIPPVLLTLTYRFCRLNKQTKST